MVIFLGVLFGSILLQSSSTYAINPSTSPSPAKQVYPVHSFMLRNDNTFEFDGQKIVLAGATVNYFRIPREHWEHRLQLLAKSGLNTLFTAIEWSTHEPYEGVFRFTEDADFIYFIRIAERLGLKVILRPGPFIGEQRDLGGYPSWLLWKKAHPNLNLTDQDFRHSVATYFRELLPRVKPLLAAHGGPVVMLEITEEDAACDWLMKIFKKRLGSHVLCRTYQDPAALRNSSSTVSSMNGWRAAPLVTFGNSWTELWRGEYERLQLSYFDLLQTLVDTLDAGKSIGLGAFHTGTDFGFKAGSALRKDQVVAYSTADVDSLVAEDGGVRPMYPVLQTIACSFFGLNFDRFLTKPPVKDFGPLMLWPVGSLLDPRVASRLAKNRLEQRAPATFEDLRQGEGFALYETTIKRNYTKAVLHLHTLRDRAQVYVDRKLMGVAYRGQKPDVRVGLGDVREGARLQILVENLGRPYWGSEPPKLSFKGLSVASAVVIDMDIITDWTSLGLPFENILGVHQLVSDQVGGVLADEITEGTPLLVGADFEIRKVAGEMGDTFLDMRGWGRGVVFLNGRVLGRYWPDGGSRKGLYIPRSYLRPQSDLNHVAVLELENVPSRKHIVFRVHLVDFRWAPMCNVAVGLLLLLLCLVGMLYYGKDIRVWRDKKRGGREAAVGASKEAGEGTSVET